MINKRCANVFCIEDIANIENYEQAINDKTQTWDCHHRREIDENKSKSQLIAEKLYYHRPASELIFLTKSDHLSLHNKGKNNPMFGKRGEKSPRFGKHHSEESRKKMSEKAKLRAPISEETRKKLSMSRSGEKHPMFGKHLSEETRKKLSIANSGEKNPRFGKRGYWFGKCGEKSYWFGKHHSEESRKKMSIARKGKFCGEKSYWFGKHHSEETRKKISLSQSGENNSVFGTQWWNNGAINKRSRECPGQGWIRGRIKTVLKTK